MRMPGLSRTLRLSSAALCLAGLVVVAPSGAVADPQSDVAAYLNPNMPLNFGVDAVHGFGHPFEAPLFPQSIGIGATWDPAMARVAGDATSKSLAATGWTWDFAPVQDLYRDNRWGRAYETWSEEPA